MTAPASRAADATDVGARRPSPAEIHVWTRRLNRGACPSATSLSPDERERAERFLRPWDRHAFVEARAWLRTVLGRYLARDPRAIAFGYGPFGKPYLAEEGALGFNLSHSGDLAVLAVSLDAAVGIDVEQVRPMREGVAEHAFSTAENVDLRRLPAAEREAAFFRCWTRKEAYLKARGDGLSVPLERFTVSVEATAARLLDVAGDPHEASRWRIADLDLEEGYAGALAARQGGWSVVRIEE